MTGTKGEYDMEETCETKEVVERRHMRAPRLSGMILSALIGAGVALLAAPYAGTETRDKLRAKTIEMKDTAALKALETRDRVSEIAQTGAERAVEMKDRGQSLLEQGRITIESAIEGIREGIRTYRDPDGQPENYLATPLASTGGKMDDTEPYRGHESSPDSLDLGS